MITKRGAFTPDELAVLERAFIRLSIERGATSSAAKLKLAREIFEIASVSETIVAEALVGRMRRPASLDRHRTLQRARGRPSS